ncbi:MAG: LCP family protein [Clostridia bacterium]|nr:LCP family protein [Clostridia bacterium]
MSHHHHHSKLKKVLKVIIIILIVVAVLGVAGFFLVKSYLKNKTGKIQYEELNVTADDLGISEEQQKNTKYRNIAILGTDSRYNDYDDFARTDCIMVASINTENNDVTLFSIYRDTLVEMDLYDKTRMDKINHSYYGGVETTLKTINTNFDLNIQEYVIVDFEAVAEIVDKVGGIELNITDSELKFINYYVKGNTESTGIESSKVTKTGKQMVDGIQALAYARIRYTEGSDYKRADRMRTVLEKTVEKLKQKGVKELNSIADEIMPKIRTNITSDSINELLPKAVSFNIVKKFGFAYNSRSMALDLKDYYEGTKKGVDYYDVPLSFTEDVEKLHRETFGEEDYVAPDKIREIEAKIKETAHLN